MTKKLRSGQKGGKSEGIAKVEFLRRGWNVAPLEGELCEVDFIAYHRLTRRQVRVQVKTGGTKRNQTRRGEDDGRGQSA